MIFSIIIEFNTINYQLYNNKQFGFDAFNSQKNILAHYQ